MKKLFVFAAAILVLTTFISCEIEDAAEQGTAAAVEFCSCLETKTTGECEAELEDEYTKAEYTDSDFVAAFNASAEPTCGVTLTVYTTNEP